MSAASPEKERERVWIVTYMNAEKRLAPVRVMATGFITAAGAADRLRGEKGWLTAEWQLVAVERGDVQ